MKAQQRVYVTLDGKTAVPAGHPDAARLFAAKGTEISEKRAATVRGAMDLLNSEAAPPEDEEADEEGDGLEAKKLIELRAIAAGDNIELGDATKKSDVIAAIRLHREAAAK